MDMHSCISTLFFFGLMAAYTEMVNAQLNIHGGLMFTENCLIANIVKL